jgi:hypothetical protein
MKRSNGTAARALIPLRKKLDDRQEQPARETTGMGEGHPSKVSSRTHVPGSYAAHLHALKDHQHYEAKGPPPFTVQGDGSVIARWQTAGPRHLHRHHRTAHHGPVSAHCSLRCLPDQEPAPAMGRDAAVDW